VIVRHSPKCRTKHPTYDQHSRKCNCRKALYIYEGGQDRTISAKTRSWEEAEKFAQREWDRRDPAKQYLQELEDHEAQKVELQKAKNITVSVATERWLRSVKTESVETAVIYKRAAWRIATWAADRGIETVRGIAADVVDEWRGTWDTTAEKRYSRIGPTSQSHFQGRLRRFCR